MNIWSLQRSVHGLTAKGGFSIMEVRALSLWTVAHTPLINPHTESLPGFSRSRLRSPYRAALKRDPVMLAGEGD